MDRIDSLRRSIVELDHASDQRWFSELEERKKRESEFHDQMRDRKRLSNPASDTYEEFYTNHRFYRTARYSREYFNQWIESHVRDKVVIDFACGDGNTTVLAAQAGARLAVGIDISNTSVQNARANAERAGVGDRAMFFCGDCEKTGLPAGCADVILCAGVLHHLDLQHAYPEISRLLGIGGVALAFEALDYNPVIKLYRNRTHHLRTEWERSHILSLKDVRQARKYFDIGEIRYFHLTSILGVWIPGFLPLLNRVDSVLTKIPGVQLLSWMFTFELLSRRSQPA